MWGARSKRASLPAVSPTSSPAQNSLRHGGVSEDILRRGRSLAVLQRRGGRGSQASVRQEPEEAKIPSGLHNGSLRLLHYSELVEADVLRLLLAPATLPCLDQWSQPNCRETWRLSYNTR